MRARRKTDPFLGWRMRAREKLVPDSEGYRKLVEAYFDDEHYGRLTPAFYRKGNGPQAESHVA